MISYGGGGAQWRLQTDRVAMARGRSRMCPLPREVRKQLFQTLVEYKVTYIKFPKKLFSLLQLGTFAIPQTCIINTKLTHCMGEH